MDTCLKCRAGKGIYSYRLLEVQTLPVRGIDGEKRVQALGLFQEYSVCAQCAAARLEAALHPKKRLLCTVFLFGGILFAGLLLTQLFWERGGPIPMMGLSSLVCGVLGGAAGLLDILTARNTYSRLPKEEALERAAWACILEAAPKKSEDSDLTYIPVNNKTLSLKNGDLMILYGLLPEVAVKAHQMIHETPS